MKCQCAPSFLSRHIQSGAFLMPKAQGMDWELPECKCLLLCANAWRKATLVPTRMRAKSQAASFGKTINQLGQVAKTEAICLMEENPAGVRDLIREAWVYFLDFSSSQSKSECWSGSYYWIMTAEDELAQVDPFPAAGDPLACPTAISTQNVRSVLFKSSRQVQWPPSHPRGISFIQLLHAFLI